jgi:hypothetical protein
MMQHTEQRSYRGVKCLHCTQPIAIPSIVASIEVEFRAGVADSQRHHQCQAFNLRCLSCGKERPYRIGEILEFKGTSTNVTRSAEPASINLFGLAPKSKAANA